MTKGTLKKTEFQEQWEVFSWAKESELKYPLLKYLHCSLNGVKLTMCQAVNAKRSGMKKGVPDISLPVKSDHFSGLFIELKSENGRPSPGQKEFLQFLNSQGYFAVFCYGSKQAIEVIETYLKGAK